MKHIRHKILAVLILFFVIVLAECSYASHAMGADLQYVCIDPANNTYRVILRFYRDCAGINVASSLNLNVESQQCGQSFAATLTLQPCPTPNPNGGTPCEVSQLCPNALGLSSCNGGSYPGVQAYTYSAIIKLPVPCSDWVLRFSECCRNSQITNLINPDSEDMYLEARINNTGGICNNSPEFTTLPVPYLCSNQPFNYNHGATDIDGDSLVYSLIAPMTAGGAPITHTGLFSPTYPLQTSPPNNFGFNTLNGQMSFTPDGIQVAVITVKVDEYRNGVWIGSTIRDLQVVVLNLPSCLNPSPSFTSVIGSSLQNGIYSSPWLVQVCPGQTLTFSTLAIEQTGDSVFHTSNIQQAIPASQYVTSYASPDSNFGYFTWTPTPTDTGIHTFVVNIKNNSCPISSTQAYAISIQVLSGTYAGPDVSYCPAGGPVQLQAYGGSVFSWSPAAGLSNPNISNPLASPPVTTQYIVTSNLTGACKNTDTVIVQVVSDFTYTLSLSKDTVCRFEQVQLAVNPDPAYAPYQYNWSPAAVLNNPQSSSPTAILNQTTHFTVTVTSSAGCSIKDTLSVIVDGQGPSIKLIADKTKVCPGDTIKLKADISTHPCGLNVIPCSGNYVIKKIGGGNLSLSQGSPYAGQFSDARIQILFKASELTAQGMQPGTITDIAFDVTQKNSTIPYDNFTIKMGCTELNYLSDFVGGLQVVANPVPYGNTTGINTHTFDYPYDWDGHSNLILEICYNGNAFSGTDAVEASNTGYNSVLFRYADNTIGCFLTNPTTTTFRPNVRFVQCMEPIKPVTYQWSPATGILQPDSSSTKIILQQSTVYTLNVSDGKCSNSASISLQIDTSFYISAGPDVSACNGQPAQLQAQLIGNPPSWVGGIECGMNGTPCPTGNVTRTYQPAGSASSNITIFDGALFGNIEDQRTQILYRAADLTSAGFTPGTISRVGFHIPVKNTLFPYNNVTIKMGCTSLDSLSNAWENTQTVATVNPYITILGWNEFQLTNPFDWDGQTNLIIEVCWDNPDAFPSSGADPLTAVNAGYNCFHKITSSLSVGCNLNGAGTLHQSLPALRLTMCTAPTAPVTYTWSPPTGLSATNISNPTASPTVTTTYTVTAYFGGVCPKVDSVTVTPATFSYSVSSDTQICAGQTVQLFAQGGHSYNWSPIDHLSCSSCANPLASPVSSTDYVLIITDTLTGCVVNDTLRIDVLYLDASTLWSDTLVDQGTPVQIFSQASGGSGQYTYLWSPTLYLDNPASQNPVSTPLTDITYNLTVTSGPCTDTASVNIKVNIIHIPVVMPNVFTPNGDGKNDTYFPLYLHPAVNVKAMRIYNRYGQLIHDSATPWDGTFTGAPQPAGTYLYYVVISRPMQSDENLQGSFSLLR
ncbi:MAG: gliding motility-associated C-terminal domain-containing protein [Chitinophagales bacterium]|nr:gliding motility-associated C-terminal domain-containing protein [Chitinophagales bacterium]